MARFRCHEALSWSIRLQRVSAVGGAHAPCAWGPPKHRTLAEEAASTQASDEDLGGSAPFVRKTREDSAYCVIHLLGKVMQPAELSSL